MTALPKGWKKDNILFVSGVVLALLVILTYSALHWHGDTVDGSKAIAASQAKEAGFQACTSAADDQVLSCIAMVKGDRRSLVLQACQAALPEMVSSCIKDASSAEAKYTLLLARLNKCYNIANGGIDSVNKYANCLRANHLR